MILDGGASQVGLESTILSLVESPPRILRHGAVTAEQLSTALGIEVDRLVRSAPDIDGVDPAGLIAPGQMTVHYAPATPVMLWPTWAAGEQAGRAALITLSAGSLDAAKQQAFSAVRSLSDKGDLSEVARRLFATLRELDQLDLDCIVVDTCEEEGLGRAIMDRLKRAAARTEP